MPLGPFASKSRFKSFSVNDDLKAAGLALGIPAGDPVFGPCKQLITATFLNLNRGGGIDYGRS